MSIWYVCLTFWTKSAHEDAGITRAGRWNVSVAPEILIPGESSSRTCPVLAPTSKAFPVPTAMPTSASGTLTPGAATRADARGPSWDGFDGFFFLWRFGMRFEMCLGVPSFPSSWYGMESVNKDDGTRSNKESSSGFSVKTAWVRINSLYLRKNGYFDALIWMNNLP